MDQRSVSAGDGESSVSDSHTGISEDRLDSINSANYQIEIIATSLQELIELKEEGGELSPVSRGLLLRVRLLTECISVLTTDGVPPDMLANAKEVLDGQRVAL